MNPWTKIVIWISLFNAQPSYGELETWKVYKDDEKVKQLLSQFKNERNQAAVTTDANSQFLHLLNNFLLAQGAYMQCKGYYSLKIGYIDPSGKRVTAGLTPESVDDLELREKYKLRCAQNAINGETAREVIEIKIRILDSLRQIIPSLDETHRSNAKSIVEKLADSDTFANE